MIISDYLPQPCDDKPIDPAEIEISDDHSGPALTVIRFMNNLGDFAR